MDFFTKRKIQRNPGLNTRGFVVFSYKQNQNHIGLDSDKNVINREEVDKGCCKITEKNDPLTRLFSPKNPAVEIKKYPHLFKED